MSVAVIIFVVIFVVCFLLITTQKELFQKLSNIEETITKLIQPLVQIQTQTQTPQVQVHAQAHAQVPLVQVHAQVPQAQAQPLVQTREVTKTKILLETFLELYKGRIKKIKVSDITPEFNDDLSKSSNVAMYFPKDFKWTHDYEPVILISIGSEYNKQKFYVPEGLVESKTTETRLFVKGPVDESLNSQEFFFII
jgi:hypothetical protein